MKEKFIYHLTSNLTANQYTLNIKKFPLLKEGEKTVFFDSGVGGEIRLFKSELMIPKSYNREVSLNNLQYTLYCNDDQLKDAKNLAVDCLKNRVANIELELNNAKKLINKKIKETIC